VSLSEELAKFVEPCEQFQYKRISDYQEKGSLTRIYFGESK